mgnify:CR=1 FL=1
MVRMTISTPDAASSTDPSAMDQGTPGVRPASVSTRCSRPCPRGWRRLSVRAVSDQPVDAIPLSSALFLSPTHQAVFGAVVDLVDTDTPLTPTLVAERVTARGDHNRAQRTLLDMAAQGVPDIDVLAADLDLHGLAPIH